MRPAAVEAQIDEAIQLDLTGLKARLRVTDRQAPDYLRSECLVHLVRKGRRAGDQVLIGAVLPVLLGRCEVNLIVKIPDGRLPDAASLREEVLGQFSELFAIDGLGEHRDYLDFYECRFNLAFRALRIDLVRRETTRLRHVAPLPEQDENGEPDTLENALALVSEASRVLPTQEWEVLRKPLADAIEALPLNERNAVILVHVLGYKEESEDPDEATAATRCNCTGRTIRNRLTRAAAKLARFKEEL